MDGTRETDLRSRSSSRSSRSSAALGPFAMGELEPRWLSLGYAFRFNAEGPKAAHICHQYWCAWPTRTRNILHPKHTYFSGVAIRNFEVYKVPLTSGHKLDSIKIRALGSFLAGAVFGGKTRVPVLRFLKVQIRGNLYLKELSTIVCIKYFNKYGKFHIFEHILVLKSTQNSDK